MTITQPRPPDTQLILNRLDAIMRELESLRRQIIMPSPPPTNLTDQLFGSLGKGTWEEYELDLDWQRFAI